MTAVVFQTSYQIDPYDFDPIVHSIHGAILWAPNEKYGFWIFKHGVESRDETGKTEPELLIVGRIECDVSEIVAHVLEGDISIDEHNSHDFDGYPSEYGELMLEVYGRLDSLASRSLDLVAWRFGLGGGPTRLSSSVAVMRWRFGQIADRAIDPFHQSFSQIPYGIVWLGRPNLCTIKMTESEQKQLSSILESPGAAPLGHALLRESWRHKDANPRSALVMGVAAAETGLKECVTVLSPATTWLIENLPAPPLAKIMKEYLPLLKAKNTFGGKVLPPPKNIRRSLHKMIECRNEVVHGKPTSLSAEALNEGLSAVRDLLYLLDFYQGLDWALELLSENCRDALNSNNAVE